MSVDLPELTREDAALLAQFRMDESPSPAVADRVHRRVRARLAEVDSQPSLVSRWTTWLRMGGLTVAIAAAVLLVVAGSSRLIGRLSADRETPNAASDTLQRRGAEGIATPHDQASVAPTIATPPKIVVPEPVAPATTDAPAEWPGVADALDESRNRAKPGKPAPVPATVSVDAAAEIKLVSAAKSEKDAQARLDLIRQHGREFAGGKLGREVAILEIQTLCALGRKDDAQSKARTFVEKNPGSAYASIATRACKEP
ncbi:MAG TPA: hypothetical protein VG755_40500 [Nannocystaceae bacterium]|nr:hypothetical protein [Nannocystaceae bacterium]